MYFGMQQVFRCLAAVKMWRGFVTLNMARVKSVQGNLCLLHLMTSGVNGLIVP